MRRAVVNVSTGDHYHRGQARLREAFKKIDPGTEFISWTDFPPGSPSHQQKPHAFKAYALALASYRTDLALWCDASIVPLKSVEPVWERIKSYGYWISANYYFSNYQWTTDGAYADLFPHMTIENARELNRSIPHAVSGCFGLDFTNPIGQHFLSEFFRLATTKAFCGPLKNDGTAGPADVEGHRTDQTVLSVIAYRLGMKLTNPPEIFSYPPGDETTIFLADGKYV